MKRSGDAHPARHGKAMIGAGAVSRALRRPGRWRNQRDDFGVLRVGVGAKDAKLLFSET